MAIIETEQKMKETLKQVVMYADKNFKKTATYQKIFALYEKWGKKASKYIVSGKSLPDKVDKNYHSLHIIISLMEFMNASSTQSINASIVEDEKFVREFYEYEKFKIFDRNKQNRDNG